MKYFSLFLLLGIFVTMPNQASACNGGSDLDIMGPTSIPLNSINTDFMVFGSDNQTVGNSGRNYLVAIEHDPGINIAGTCGFFDNLENEVTLFFQSSGPNRIETINTIGIGTASGSNPFSYPSMSVVCDLVVFTSNQCGNFSFETALKREGNTFQSEVTTFNVPCPPPPPSVTLLGPDQICRNVSLEDPYVLNPSGGVTVTNVNWSASNGVSLSPQGNIAFAQGFGTANDYTVTVTFFRSDQPGVLQTLTKSTTIINCLEAPDETTKAPEAESLPATVDINPITKESQSVSIGKLFPNPASAQVFIPVDCFDSATEIMLTDIMGRPQRSLSTKASGNHRIDLAGLPKGTYYVSVRNECGNSLQQLMIQ